jgi:hypothetical protein
LIFLLPLEVPRPGDFRGVKLEGGPGGGKCEGFSLDFSPSGVRSFLVVLKQKERQEGIPVALLASGIEGATLAALFHHSKE